MTGYALTETPLGQPLGRDATELEPKDGRRRATLGSSNSSRIVLGDRSDDRSPRRRRHSFHLALRGCAQRRRARGSRTRNNSQLEQQATTHFWREREAANEYFLGVTEAEERDLRGGKGLRRGDGRPRRRRSGRARVGRRRKSGKRRVRRDVPAASRRVGPRTGRQTCRCSMRSAPAKRPCWRRSRSSTRSPQEKPAERRSRGKLGGRPGARW